ncbi:Detected protein of unknown function [Hibiscus syriacus]|uniref:Uncharacterized protein n=1 Tax=Hibiscus syriacus TaxID=106335 RepID=A0A6A2XEI9_HIBSY|nr:Detected protein of unknown function [Hibiscus syriacus]
MPETRPPPCDTPTYKNCKCATLGQMLILVCALFFKSIGAGGIRPCLMPFGADQLSNKSQNSLESYVSWYCAAASLGGSLGLTVAVYIIEMYGWTIGYGVCTFIMFLAAVVFYNASPLYVKPKASTSLFTGFVQVLVVSYKNRKLPIPAENSGYLHGANSKITVQNEKLKFLNKVSIIRDANGSVQSTLDDPWRITQSNQEGLVKYTVAMVNMSAKWLLPQYIVMGIAEALSTLGQFEFYHRVFPKTMSSIANSLFFLSLSLAHLLSSALFNIVNHTTARDGKPGWVAENLKEARFDYYYLLLAGLSLLNVFYYINCCRSYGSTSDVVDEDYA